MKTLGLNIEYEEYKKRLIFDGYIKEDGQPLNAYIVIRLICTSITNRIFKV